MPLNSAPRWLRQLKQFGLSLPDTQPKAPWPGHDDVAVHNKTFAYLVLEDDGHTLRVSVKLPASGPAALIDLARSNARPSRRSSAWGCWCCRW